MSNEDSLIFSDLHLSRRLEKAEARSNADFVEARAKVSPESGALWTQVAGAYAMYDGAASPLTQTFCLGVFEAPSRADMERLEQFFGERGAPVFHEVSPLADQGLLALLNERGYQPIEFTSVMFRQIRPGSGLSRPRDESIRVRVVGADEQGLWARTAARGWSEFAELSEFMQGLAEVSAKRSEALSFLAESEGQAVAAGALSICEGVALLAGASTVPEWRKRGAQLALLDARLSYAAGQGCDIAMICTQPGSASQRNAERHGFRIAYTRVKWQLARPADAAP
jgi:GNAT superfamily N-acetyltransferase